MAWHRERGDLAEIAYVIGAGVNQSVKDWEGLRPPLATNFFQTALRSRKFSDDDYSERIRPLYEYIEQNWGKTKSHLLAEPLNLEEVFTRLGLQRKEARGPGDEEQRGRLLNVEILLKRFLAEFLADFDDFARDSKTMRTFGQILHRERPAILTFNYDCILEGVLESASGLRTDMPRPGVRPSGVGGAVTDEELSYSHCKWNRALAYGIRFDEVQLQRPGFPIFVDRTRFYGHADNTLYSWPLLKLHGSLNWFRYLQVRRHAVPYEDIPKFPQEKRGAVVLTNEKWWFTQPPERDGWLLDPLLITPVLKKQRDLRHPVFDKLWKRARSELSGCRRLVVIGYSFPRTDSHVRRLFQKAFQAASPDDVIVVNPDDAPVRTVEGLCHKPALHCPNLDDYVSFVSAN